MFSPLVKGSGTWDGRLQVIKDEFIQPSFDALFPSIQKSPDPGTFYQRTCDQKSSKHCQDNKYHDHKSIELPKTFLTRKGAIVLFASPKEYKDPEKTKLENIDANQTPEYHGCPDRQGSISGEKDLQFIQKDSGDKDENTCEDQIHSTNHRRKLFMNFLKQLIRKQADDKARRNLSNNSTNKDLEQTVENHDKQDAADPRSQLLRPKTIGSLFQRRSSVGCRKPKSRPKTVCSIPPEPEQLKAHPRITSAKPNQPTRALGKLSLKKNISSEFDQNVTIPHLDGRVSSPVGHPASPDTEYRDDSERFSTSRYRPTSRLERGHVSRSASSASRYSAWWMVDNVSVSQDMLGDPTTLSVADNSLCPEIIECLERDNTSLGMFDVDCHSRPVSSICGSAWELSSDAGLSMVDRMTIEQSEYQGGRMSKMSSRFYTDGAKSRPSSSLLTASASRMTGEHITTFGRSDSLSYYGETRPPTRSSAYAITHDGDVDGGSMVDENRAFSPSFGPRSRPATRNTVYDHDNNDAMVDDNHIPCELPSSCGNSRPPTTRSGVRGLCAGDNSMVNKDLVTSQLVPNSALSFDGSIIDEQMSRGEHNRECLNVNTECKSRARSAPLMRKSISSRKPKFVTRRARSAGVQKNLPTNHPTTDITYTTPFSPSPPPSVSYHVRLPSTSDGNLDIEQTQSDDEGTTTTEITSCNVVTSLNNADYFEEQWGSANDEAYGQSARPTSENVKNHDIDKDSNSSEVSRISPLRLEETDIMLNQQDSPTPEHKRTFINKNDQREISMAEERQETFMLQENTANEELAEQTIATTQIDTNGAVREDDLRPDRCIFDAQAEEHIPVDDTASRREIFESLSSFGEVTCSDEDDITQDSKDKIYTPDEKGARPVEEVNKAIVSEEDHNIKHGTQESESVTSMHNEISETVEQEIIEEPCSDDGGSSLETVDGSTGCLEQLSKEKNSEDTQVLHNNPEPQTEEVKNYPLQNMAISEKTGLHSTNSSKPIPEQNNTNDLTHSQSKLVKQSPRLSGLDHEPDSTFSKLSDSYSANAEESFAPSSVRRYDNNGLISKKPGDNSTQKKQSTTTPETLEISEKKTKQITSSLGKNEKEKSNHKNLDVQGIGKADGEDVDKVFEKKKLIIGETSKVDLADLVKRNNALTKNKKTTTKTYKPAKRSKAREEPEDVTVDVIPAVDENLLKALENPDAFVELSEETLNQFAPIEHFEDPELLAFPEEKNSNAHSPSKVKKSPKKGNGRKKKGKIPERNNEAEERKRKMAEEKDRRKEEFRLLREREEEQKRIMEEMKAKQKTIEDEREKRLEQEAEAKRMEKEAMAQLKEAKRKAKEEREKRREEEAERRRQEVQRKREEKRRRELEIQERENELEKQRWDREARMAELQARRERENELERMAEEERQEEERLRLLEFEEEQRLEEERIREAEEAVQRVAREREYREQMRKIAEAQQAKLEKQEADRRLREDEERRIIEEERSRLEQEQIARDNEERERVRQLRHHEALARMRAAHEASKRRAWALRQRERNIERMTDLKHTRQSQKITEAFTFTYNVHIPRKVWELPYNWNSKTARRGVRPRKKKKKPQ